MWGFWRRHKWKVLVTLGVVGGGCAFYKLHNACRHRLSELERQLTDEKEHDELVKAQMQEHFTVIQQIADSTTLPHAMKYLSGKVAEGLDLSLLTERLQQGKGQPSSLTSSEKLELWEQLKILSFTRMVLSLWAMTILTLYIRVQVNILGRHLYLDTGRGVHNSHLLVVNLAPFLEKKLSTAGKLKEFATRYFLNEDVNLIDSEDEQQFLASADFLASSGLLSLIYNMQTAATECLRSKQLRDIFNPAVLHDTVKQILDTFICMGRPFHWVEYLMPGDTSLDKPSSSFSGECGISKFEQLMEETRSVLSSVEFRNVVDVSLRTLVDALVKDVTGQLGGDSAFSGIPLAKLLPRIAQMGPVLLGEPSKNRFVEIITNVQEVELFFSLLYANGLSM